MTEPQAVAEAPHFRRPDPAPGETASGVPGGGGKARILVAAGVSVVVHLPEQGLPEVLHWGRDLGDLSDGDFEQLRRARSRPVSPSALDDPWPLTLLPGEPDGWEGRPGFAAHRAGQAQYPGGPSPTRGPKPTSRPGGCTSGPRPPDSSSTVNCAWTRPEPCEWRTRSSTPPTSPSISPPSKP
ncbi:hypothetical protein GCM10029992_50970 [Glycomyces albus]